MRPVMAIAGVLLLSACGPDVTPVPERPARTLVAGDAGVQALEGSAQRNAASCDATCRNVADTCVRTCGQGTWTPEGTADTPCEHRCRAAQLECEQECRMQD